MAASGSVDESREERIARFLSESVTSRADLEWISQNVRISEVYAVYQHLPLPVGEVAANRAFFHLMQCKMEIEGKSKSVQSLFSGLFGKTKTKEQMADSETFAEIERLHDERFHPTGGRAAAALSPGSSLEKPQLQKSDRSSEEGTPKPSASAGSPQVRRPGIDVRMRMQAKINDSFQRDRLPNGLRGTEELHRYIVIEGAIKKLVPIANTATVAGAKDALTAPPLVAEIFSRMENKAMVFSIEVVLPTDRAHPTLFFQNISLDGDQLTTLRGSMESIQLLLATAFPDDPVAQVEAQLLLLTADGLVMDTGQVFPQLTEHFGDLATILHNNTDYPVKYSFVLKCDPKKDQVRSELTISIPVTKNDESTGQPILPPMCYVNLIVKGTHQEGKWSFQPFHAVVLSSKMTLLD